MKNKLLVVVEQWSQTNMCENYKSQERNLKTNRTEHLQIKLKSWSEKKMQKTTSAKTRVTWYNKTL